MVVRGCIAIIIESIPVYKANDPVLGGYYRRSADDLPL